MPKHIATLFLILTLPIHAWAGPVEDQALRDAAGNLDIEAVKNDLTKGANPNSFDLPNHVTPLREVTNANLLGATSPYPAAKQSGLMDLEVAHSRATEITKILFAAGAKIGPYDRKILWEPIASGNLKQVALLVDKGASVRAKIEGYTPTEIARKYGQNAIYDLLISHDGIPVDSRSSAQLVLVQAAGSYPGDALAAAAAG